MLAREFNLSLCRQPIYYTVRTLSGKGITLHWNLLALDKWPSVLKCMPFVLFAVSVSWFACQNQLRPICIVIWRPTRSSNSIYFTKQCNRKGSNAPLNKRCSILINPNSSSFSMQRIATRLPALRPDNIKCKYGWHLFYFVRSFALWSICRQAILPRNNTHSVCVRARSTASVSN